MESCSKVLVNLFLVQRSFSEGKFAGTYNSLIIPDSGVHDSVHLLESEVLRRKARSQKAQGYSKTTTQSILLSQIHPNNSRGSEQMKKITFYFYYKKKKEYMEQENGLTESHTYSFSKLKYHHHRVPC